MEAITITRAVIGPEIKVSVNDEVIGIVNSLKFSDKYCQHNIVRIGELFFK